MRKLRRAIRKEFDEEGIAGLLQCLDVMVRQCAYEASGVPSPDDRSMPIWKMAQKSLSELYLKVGEMGLQSGEIVRGSEHDEDDPLDGTDLDDDEDDGGEIK